jgi:4-amino-4-deoxy-L-arabinose transferase-like glycosyltransferase
MQTPPTQEISTPAEASGTARTYFPSRRELFLLLIGYFTLQVIIRVACSSSTDLDESEAVVLAQKLGWGYGPDGPLYTWIQALFFTVFGQSIFGLSLLKNLLLLSIYLLTYATARLVTRWEAAAVAAALSLFYQPGIAWEAQRDLTHSVLATAFSLATLFCFLRLAATRRTVWYVLLGLCCGFGILTKYNYALWCLGLLLGGLSLRQFRPALWNWRLLVSLGLAVLIFLPNGLWMLDHSQLATQTSGKFDVKQTLSLWEASRVGLKNVTQSLLSFAAPIALIYVILFLKRPGQTQGLPAPDRGYRNVILCAWLWIGLVLVCLIVFARATGFKERWFQPILVALPVAAISLAQGRLNPFRLKCILALSVTVMAAVAIVMPGRLFAAEWLKREEPLTRPYAQLAIAIHRSIPAGSLVLCDTRLLAGNMRLHMADATVLTPDLRPLFPQPFPRCFLLWDARDQDRPPADLREWARNHEGGAFSGVSPAFYSAVYQHHQSKQFRLGLIRLY